MERIEGILRAVSADGNDPERVRRAREATARLQAQLGELQLAEVALGAQVGPVN